MSKSLVPQKSQLFHRDCHVKSLKIIIYLEEVGNHNGPFELVYPEKRGKVTWYQEKKYPNDVARTTRQELVKNNMTPITVTGAKYTCILFDGSIIHSGGYIAKGERKSIYIEINKKKNN